MRKGVRHIGLHPRFLFFIWVCLLCTFSSQHVNALEISADKKYIVAAGNPKLSIFDIEGSTRSPVRCEIMWSYEVIV